MSLEMELAQALVRQAEGSVLRVRDGVARGQLSADERAILAPEVQKLAALAAMLERDIT
jgi:hypothetical protein